MDEAQLAQLAAQRATNPEVRSFAQKLATAHQKVNSQLTQLAGQKSVQIESDDDKGRTYKRLSKKSGAEFDQEFVEHMVDEHEKAIKMYEKASTDAKDPAIRSFASSHVGSLREHLQQAQSLRQTVMASASTSTGSRSSSDTGTRGNSDYGSGRSTSGGTTGSGLGTSSTGSSTGSSTDRSGTSSDTSGTSRGSSNTPR
jgi:putative membrane protein